MSRRWKGSYLSYVVTFFFFYYCLSAFSSVLSVYLTQIGIGIADLSLIISSASLFGFFLVPAAGYLSDRTGRPRQLCALLMVGFGIFALLFSASRAVGVLFLLHGISMSLLNAVMPVLERLAGAAKYRYGVLRIWGTVGYAAGAQMAGFILQNLPSRFLFVSVLAAGCLAAVGIAGAEDPLAEKESETSGITGVTGRTETTRMAARTGNAAAPEGKSPEGKAPKGLGYTVRTLTANHQYLLYLLIAFLFWGSSAVNMTYVPILLTDLGVHTSVVGTILSVGTLVEIPLILFSNRFMDRFSSRTLVFFACGITVVEFLTFGLTSSVAAVTVVIIFLKSIATTLFMMITLKTVRSLLPRELITTGLSVVNTTNNIGLILLQNLGGRLLEKISLSSFYLILAGIICCVMVLNLFLRAGYEGNVFE